MSSHHSSSSCVYILDSTHGWLPANVISTDPTENVCTVTVAVPASPGSESSSPIVEPRTIELSSYPNGVLPLQNVDENGNLLQMADMCDLPSLHEASILYNVKARYEGHQLPYTRVGDIIIAVNPFEWIESLYSQEMRDIYSERLVWNGKSTT